MGAAGRPIVGPPSLLVTDMGGAEVIGAAALRGTIALRSGATLPGGAAPPQ
jgi:hypothetical protein